MTIIKGSPSVSVLNYNHVKKRAERAVCRFIRNNRAVSTAFLAQFDIAGQNVPLYGIIARNHVLNADDFRDENLGQFTLEF